MRTLLCTALALALVLACGGPDRAGDDIFDEVPADHPLVGYEGWFLLTWNGARVGDAHERLARRPDARGGFRFTRTESIAIARAGELVEIRTELTIDTDDDLEARRVHLEQRSGEVHLVGTAVRDPDGWSIQWAGDPPRRAPAAAVPLALLPLASSITPADYRGPVLLEGYGFAEAELELDRTGAAELRAHLRTRYGETATTIVLRPDGTVDRIEGLSGAIRVSRDQVATTFTALDVIDSATLPFPEVPAAGRALIVEPVRRGPPPPLPGQRTRIEGDRWIVELDPAHRPEAPAGLSVEPQPHELETAAESLLAEAGALTPMAEARALAVAVAQLIEDDGAAPVTSARAALDAGRGDCTTHALLFRALAATRGIPTRLVTGYRWHEGRWVRHRWVAAAVEGRWLAVDPTYGEAPAAPRLLGLAVHDGAPHELILADEFTFLGLEDAAIRNAD